MNVNPSSQTDPRIQKIRQIIASLGNGKLTTSSTLISVDEGLDMIIEDLDALVKTQAATFSPPEKTAIIDEALINTLFTQSLYGFFLMMLDEPVYWNETVDKEQLLDYVFAHQRITNVNNAMLAQYRATREQFLDLTPADFFSCDIAYGKTVCRGFFDQGRLLIQTDKRRFDGTPMWIEGEYICLYDDLGRIIGHFGIQREITDQKQAETKLQNSERRLQQAQRIAEIGSWELDLVHNNLIWSDEIYRIFEIDSHQFEASYEAFLATIHPDDQDAVNAAYTSSVQNNTSYEIAHRLQMPDGRIKYVLEQGETTYDTTGQPLRSFGVVQDITAQRQAEEALRESEERLALVFNSTSDLQLLFRVEADGRLFVEAANQAYHAYLQRQFPHSPLLIVGRERNEFLASLGIPQEHIELELPIFQDVITSGISTSYEMPIDVIEYKIMLEVSLESVFNNKNQCTHLLWNGRDVSERRQAEQALQKRLAFEMVVAQLSASFVNLPIEKIDDGIHTALRHVGEVTGAVRSSLFLFSNDLKLARNTHEWCVDPSDSQQAQLLEIPADLFSRPDDLPPEAVGEREWIKQYGFRSLLFVPIVSGNVLLGTLGFYSALDETITWSEEDISLLKLVGDVIVNVLERKEVEGQLKASLHEKEVLLKEIHHRVKNNMQVISSLLDLQSEYVEDIAAREMMQESRNRVRSMALVHEQLYQSPNLAQIGFAAYVEELTSYLLQLYRDRSRQVSLELAIEDVALSVDTAVPLGLIINELVSNAYKHAFKDGRSGQITIQLQNDSSSHYCLIVQDNGSGIPSEIDFHQTSSLGLTIVLTLIDQLKGQIELKREQGTRFEIIFPLVTVNI